MFLRSHKNIKTRQTSALTRSEVTTYLYFWAKFCAVEGSSETNNPY